MKTQIKSVIIVVGILGISLSTLFFACQKESIAPLPNASPTAVQFTTGDSSQNSAAQESNGSYKTNSSNVGGIPARFYRVDPSYKNSYQHLQQRKGTDYGECSWTSYVITVACIYKANCWWNCSYPVSHAHVDQVKNTLVSRFGGNASRIDKLEWYAQNQDNNKINVYHSYIPHNGAYDEYAKLRAIKAMFNHIDAYRTPFIVVSHRGSVGHYRIVFSINWSGKYSGSRIYYTDCYDSAASSFDGNLESMDLDSFLHSMTQETSCYNMLFPLPK